MFLPLDILFEYWIENVTFGLQYVMFRFPTRIFYKRVSGFATECPCGVWCRGLTTGLLYVGLFFGNLVGNDSGFWKFDIMENNIFFVFDYVFTYILMSHDIIILYFHLLYFHVVSNSALFFRLYSDTLRLHRRRLVTFYSISLYRETLTFFLL